MTPFPDPADYQAIYGEGYYESSQYGDSSYRKERLELASCYTNVARRFKSMGVQNRLLDVGCGTGDFLLAAKREGVLGSGIELSEYAAEKARAAGLQVHHGVLADLEPIITPYDAIHCSHVLEHVPDANEFMAQLRKVLRPGAPVYIEVPLQFDGILDIINRLRGHQHRYSEYSIHHHYFFTPTALIQLLRAHAFRVLSVSTFLPCRRAMRRPGLRKVALQSVLWAADRVANRGDVIAVWARREQ